MTQGDRYQYQQVFRDLSTAAGPPPVDDWFPYFEYTNPIFPPDVAQQFNQFNVDVPPPPAVDDWFPYYQYPQPIFPPDYTTSLIAPSSFLVDATEVPAPAVTLETLDARLSDIEALLAWIGSKI